MKSGLKNFLLVCVVLFLLVAVVLHTLGILVFLGTVESTALGDFMMTGTYQLIQISISALLVIIGIYLISNYAKAKGKSGSGASLVSAIILMVCGVFFFMTWILKDVFTNELIRKSGQVMSLVAILMYIVLLIMYATYKERQAIANAEQVEDEEIEEPQIAEEVKEAEIEEPAYEKPAYEEPIEEEPFEYIDDEVLVDEEPVEEPVEEPIVEEALEEPVNAVVEEEAVAEEVVEEPLEEKVEEPLFVAPVTYAENEEQTEENYNLTMDESSLQGEEIADEDLIMPKKRRSFDLRLRTANDNVKKRYSMIRNELESYGVKGRTSRSRENYRKKGKLYARFTFKGKSLRLHLGIDPNEYINSGYKFEVAEQKGYEDIPVLLKIKSAKDVNAAIGLITLMMEKAEMKKLKKFEPVNYVEMFENTYSEFEAKGYGYMVEHTVTSDMVDKYRPIFAERIAVRIPIEGEEPKRYIKVSIRMTDINETFSDGAKIDLSVLKEKGFAPMNANYLAVSANRSISKRFYITANEISPRAVKMICLAGGQAYILYRKQKQEDKVETPAE